MVEVYPSKSGTSDVAQFDTTMTETRFMFGPYHDTELSCAGHAAHHELNHTDTIFTGRSIISMTCSFCGAEFHVTPYGCCQSCGAPASRAVN